MSSFKMPVTEIANVLPYFFQAQRTPCFAGRPGMAKTALVRVGAKSIEKLVGKHVAVREVHLASMSEVDVRGYLVPVGNESTFTKPEFWAVVEANEFGVLFLDEFMQASHEMQKAVAPLILERRIGEFYLPPGWMVVCAGNRIDDNAGSNSLLSHVLNRMFYIEVDAPEVSEWVAWAVNEGLPPELIAMAQMRPDVVFEADLPDAPDQPYCNPRSIEAVGRLANVYPGGLSELCASNVGMALLSAAVGDGATAEIAGMVRTTLRLPSFEACMAAPEVAPVPTDLAESYAMVMLVAVRAKGDLHREAAAQYLVRFPINVALTGIVALIRRDRNFLHSKAFSGWVAANRDLVKKFQKYITI